ncbi:MAG: spermidine synthase [Longimicrobiaceae bacterium]
MDASRLERDWRLQTALLGELCGVVVGVIGASGANALLPGAGSVLAATCAVAFVSLTALAAGVWSGGQEGQDAEPPSRWRTAGFVVGASAVLAVAWQSAGWRLAEPLEHVSGLLILLAAPLYAVATVLPPLAWRAGAHGPYPAGEREESAWGGVGWVAVPALAGAGVGALLALVLAPRLSPGFILLLAAAALFLPTFFPAPAADGRAERTVFERDTPFGTLRVSELSHPGSRQSERRLYLDGEEESGELVRSGASTLAYIAAAERWLAGVSEPGDRYLLLGGGAYTLPRRISERDTLARITVVERDQQVTRVAERFFGLREQHAIRSVYGDGRAVLEDGGLGQFERIFLDVYDGRERLPYQLVTSEAFTLLGRHLAPGGTLAMNAIGVGRGEGSVRLWSVVRTLGEVFPAVAVYSHLGADFPDRQNFLLAAAPEEGSLPPGAGLFVHWPESEWPHSGAAIVFRDRFEQGAGVVLPT